MGRAVQSTINAVGVEPLATRVFATLVQRRNRFVANVLVDGRQEAAHVPNSGRMHELMVPGTEVVLRPAPAGTTRKTAYDLLAVRYADRWVGVDSRTPPSMVVEAWRSGVLPGFADYTDVRREVRYGGSRLDLLFSGAPGLAYVEAKSVNLVEDGVAMFPDAPTVRGARHLLELRDAVAEGHRAAACFVVQRDDARVLRPHAEKDPVFADTLARVVAEGVEAYAIACVTTPEGTTPVGLVPIEITPGVFA
ncbi:MAG: DNA/RNA nuclease SfsA [Chloroflexi bacterium]|nr:DNA/RNA nuclease SfsA [Chloroflexota bacterium]